MKKHIQETASAGAMGGGSIAVVQGGSGDPDTPTKLKKFMKDFLKRSRNKLEFKLVNERMKSIRVEKLDESRADLGSIFSRLKNSERESYDKRSTVTYGVEDDNGNLMKITLPSDQAEEFEERLSSEMAEIEDFKSTGHKGKDISMAELLFDLKDEFKVLDVEFPTIPSDAVYNVKSSNAEIEEDTPTEEPPEMNSDKPEMGDDAMMGGQDSMGDEPNAEFGDDKDGEPMPPDTDDDSVEDFGGDEGETSESSILASVMAMLKANAEAEKAKADAEAEKARAKQAEYSAKSAQIEMGKQEEIIKMEADMEAQKEKEKDAKQMANLAKHKYNKSKSFGEGFKFSSLMNTVLEFDDNTTMQTLSMQKREINAKYRPDPKDDQATRMEKAKQKRLALQALQIDRKRVTSRDNLRNIEDENKDANSDNEQSQGEQTI